MPFQVLLLLKLDIATHSISKTKVLVLICCNLVVLKVAALALNIAFEARAKAISKEV